MTRFLIRFTVQLLLLFILLSAFYVSFWRQSLAVLPDIEYLLERQASQLLGTEVEIRGTRGQFLSFSPHLTIDSLRVQHPTLDHDVIAFRDLQFKINIWKSIRERLLVFDGIWVESGRIKLPKQGVISAKNTANLIDWQAWASAVLQQNMVFVKRIDIQQGEWRGQLVRGVLRDLPNAKKGFEGRVVLQYGSQWLSTFIQGQGQANMFGDGQGQVNVLGYQAGAPALGANPLSAGISSLHSFQGSIDIDAGEIVKLQSQLHFKPDDIKAQTLLGLGLQGRLRDGQWVFAGTSQHDMRQIPWSARYSQGGFEFEANMPIAGLLQWGRLFKPDLKLLQAFGDAKIAVKNDQFSLELDSISIEQKNAQGQDILKLGPVFAQAHGSLKQGQFNLSSSKVNLVFPRLFRDELTNIQLLKSDIFWQQKESGLVVFSDEFSLRHNDAKSRAAWRVTLNSNPSLAPHLALLAKITSTSPNQYQQYLPQGLDSRFLQWMDQAVTAGRLESGRLLFDGPLEPGNPGLQFELQADDLDFQFHPDWPKIKQGRTHVYVGPGLVDFSVAAVHEQSPVTGVGQVKGSDLSLNLQAQGQAAAAVGYLMDSPLRAKLAPVFDVLHVTAGTFKSDIDIQLSLDGDAARAASEARFGVDVSTRLNDVNALITPARLSVEALQGPLDFSLATGISSAGLTAKVFGREFALQLAKAEQSQTQLDFAGVVGAESLSQWLGWPLLARVNGEAQLHGQLLIPWDVAPVNLLVTSDLLGMSLGLPGQFGKTALQHRQWFFDLTIDEKLSFKVSDENRYTAQFALENGVLSGLDLRIGDTSNPLPLDVQPGQRWALELADLDLKPWAQVFNELPARAKSSKGEKPQGATAWSWLPKQLRFYTRNLQYGEHQFGPTRLSMNQEPAGWRLQLDGATAQGSGFLPLQQAVAPIRLDLQSLTLPVSLLKQVSNNKPQNLVTTPETSIYFDALEYWPALELNADAVFLQAAQAKPQYLGRFQMSGQPAVGGYTWQELYGQFAGVHVRARGDISAALGSEYMFEVSGGRLNRLYDVLEYGLQSSAKPVSANTVAGIFSLHWPGLTPKLDQIRGEGQFEFTDGMIQGVNGVSPIRWLSLMSAERFARRLRFDFGGLAQEGLAFDDMSVQWSLAGPLRVNQTLKLESPSLQFEAQGWVDLKAQQLFQKCVAIIPILDHLVLPAAAAGGLPAAATAFILDKVLGKSLDALTQLSWEIAGPLQEPKVVR